MVKFKKSVLRTMTRKQLSTLKKYMITLQSQAIDLLIASASRSADDELIDQLEQIISRAIDNELLIDSVLQENTVFEDGPLYQIGLN